MKNFFLFIVFLFSSLISIAQSSQQTLWKVIDSKGNEKFSSYVIIPSSDIESIFVVPKENLDAIHKKQGYNNMIVAKLKPNVKVFTLEDYFLKKNITIKGVSRNGVRLSTTYPILVNYSSRLNYTIDKGIVNIIEQKFDKSGIRIR